MRCFGRERDYGGWERNGIDQVAYMKKENRDETGAGQSPDGVRVLRSPGERVRVACERIGGDERDEVGVGN